MRIEENVPREETFRKTHLFLLRESLAVVGAGVVRLRVFVHAILRRVVPASALAQRSSQKLCGDGSEADRVTPDIAPPLRARARAPSHHPLRSSRKYNAPSRRRQKPRPPASPIPRPRRRSFKIGPQAELDEVFDERVPA